MTAQAALGMKATILKQGWAINEIHDGCPSVSAEHRHVMGRGQDRLTLLNVLSKLTQCHEHYWSAGDREVDFVLVKGGKIVAIEVKSSHRRGKLSGMEAFSEGFKVQRKLLVGGDGISVQKFITSDVGLVLRASGVS
jgi:hypothetical protein